MLKTTDKNDEAQKYIDVLSLSIMPLEGKAAILPGWAEDDWSFDPEDLGARNYGVKIGTKFIVIDVDPRSGGDESLKRLAGEMQLGEFLTSQYVVHTGGGGYHLWFKCSLEGKALKEVEGYKGIDIKTGNGYVVGTGCTHPETGNIYLPHDHLNDLENIEELPECLYPLVQRFDNLLEKKENKPQSGANRPGDDFNDRGDIESLLTGHGWTFDRKLHNGEDAWVRPGKKRGKGHSASFNGKYLYVFSTGDDCLSSGHYTKFSLYAALEHGGDYSAATKELAKMGYGGRPDDSVDLSAMLGEEEPPPFYKAVDLCKKHPNMRPPLIHGLLREGETMNVIAAPKLGKSWAVMQLALAVSSGTPWLGFPVEMGTVLVIDNELHGETIANRIPRVADAMGLAEDSWSDNIYINPVRGNLTSIKKMAGYFNSIKKEGFKLIILDAFYRFMPEGMDENDNGAMANVYNILDRYADALKTSFVLIHHTTKGNQSGKSTTDVGAGAGSQSRAADCHFVLLPHKEEDSVTVQAVTRSWKQPKPFVISKGDASFPFWKVNTDLDPEETQGNDKKEPKVVYTFEEFVDEFIDDEPQTKEMISISAEEAGLTIRLITGFLKSIEQGNSRCGEIYHWKTSKPITHWYSKIEPEEFKKKSKKEMIEELLRINPKMIASDISKELDIGMQYVYKLMKSIKGEAQIELSKEVYNE